MGCSNPHPHGQIWSQSTLPNEVDKKDQQQRTYFSKNNSSLLGDYLKQELEANATDQIKGEYVSVGSLDEVSTGGNWPPSYDKQQRDKN